MITFYNLKNITPVSKPRGQIGKYGNVTHSSGNYRKFQESVNQRLTELKFSIPGEFFSLGYIFYMAKKRGRHNDLDNMAGAINDTLVKYGYISDDSWKLLSRAWLEAVPAEKFGITLIVFKDSADMVYFLTARERLLNKFQFT